MAEIDGQPGRVSPAKLELLLDERLPEVLDEDDPEWEVLPTVLRAWVGWAAERAGLSPPAREVLDEAADALLGPRPPACRKSSSMRCSTTCRTTSRPRR